MDKYLYHVTPYAYLGKISKYGLRQQKSSETGNLGQRWIGIYLTEYSGIKFWSGWVFEKALVESNKRNAQYKFIYHIIPTVLRTLRIKCDVDKGGTMDSGARAYICKNIVILPKDIEIFDCIKSIWIPINNWKTINLLGREWDDPCAPV